MQQKYIALSLPNELFRLNDIFSKNDANSVYTFERTLNVIKRRIPPRHMIESITSLGLNDHTFLVLQGLGKINPDIILSDFRHYGDLAIIPAHDQYAVFSNEAKNCPLLMMTFRSKENRSFFGFSHVYKDRIDDQLLYYKRKLSQMGYQITELVFSPREDTHFNVELRSLFGIEPIIKWRECNGDKIANTSVYVNSTGWLLYNRTMKHSSYIGDNWKTVEANTTDKITTQTPYYF